MQLGPSSLEDARHYRYGTWAGNPKGVPLNPRFCIAEIIGSGRSGLPHQCGTFHASGRPWCKRHDPDVARLKEEQRQVQQRDIQTSQDRLTTRATALFKRLSLNRAGLTYDRRTLLWIPVASVPLEELEALAARLTLEGHSVNSDKRAISDTRGVAEGTGGARG